MYFPVTSTRNESLVSDIGLQAGCPGSILFWLIWHPIREPKVIVVAHTLIGLSCVGVGGARWGRGRGVSEYCIYGCLLRHHVRVQILMRWKRIIDQGQAGRSEAGFMASYTPKCVLKYRNLIFEGRCPATRTSKDREKAEGTVRIALYYQMISASASASATVIEHGPQSLTLLGNAPLFMDILLPLGKGTPE